MKRMKRKFSKRNARRQEPVKMVLHRRQGFGINEVIGIAAGIIIAAVVIIPGLKLFSGTIMTQLSDWWSTLATEIFQG